MTKAIEDAANALAIRTALGVPTNAELAAVSDVADAAYVKPVDGIPHNDLHTGIRDQLDLADTALQPGVLPVGTTVTAAQISDAGAAGRTLLQKATLPEIQSLVSGDKLPAVAASFIGIGSSKIDFLGCSITNGSNSSNAGVTSYAVQVKTLSDHMQVSETIRHGYPGQPSSYVYTQLEASLAVAPTHLIIGPDFGTNSVGLANTEGVYNSYGQYIVNIVKRARAAGIVVYACRTMPRGIEQDQYSGTAAAAGTTSTIVLPASADAMEYLVGAQIVLNGDGVIRSLRSYNSGTRVASFTPVASAATSAATTFVISGAGGSHRGAGLQNFWLTQNAGRLGLEIIDTSTGMSNSRGFLDAAYYVSADPVHPNDAGHLKLAQIISTSLAAKLPVAPYPNTVTGGMFWNPLTQSQASGALPAGFSEIAPVTMGGVKTYTGLATALGNAPGLSWQGVFDTTASGGGNYRFGLNPAAAVTAGDKLFVIGTLEGVGTGSATLAVWNANTSVNVSSVGSVINTLGPKTFATIVSVPVGCTGVNLVVYVVTTTGNSYTVRLAGLQAWNLTQLGLI